MYIVCKQIQFDMPNMACCLFSHAPWLHARSPCVLSEKNTTLRCGVFGAFGDFGLIDLVLQTVLFSCNLTFTEITWCGGNVNIVRYQVAGQNF